MDILLQSNGERVWQYLLVVIEAVLILFALARLLSEKRQPTNTVAWLLAILLLPWVGVPLFLLLGGRKLKKLAERKSRLRLALPIKAPPLESSLSAPTSQLILSAGGTAPLGGNRLRLISEGEDYYRVLTEQILGARHSINIMTFILAKDETGRRIIDLLAKRASEGVKVRLMVDSIGTLTAGFAFCDPLRRAGGEVCRFMPVFPFWNSRNSANLRNHRKIAVFDQHTAIIGGQNIAKEYMGPTPYKKRWKDLGCLVEGPAAALLNEIFLADWSFASGHSIEQLHRALHPDTLTLRGNSDLQIVASGPDVSGDSLYESILLMIQEATQSIWMVTPYFIPDEVLLRSLMVKARAGHEVILIVPAKSNHLVPDLARRHYLRELHAAGVQIRLFSPGMIHSKAMIVDNRVGLIGSANFDIRSLFVNFEVGMLLYSPEDLKALRGYMEGLLRQCSPIGPRYKRRGRFLGHLAEDLCRLLAPLL